MSFWSTNRSSSANSRISSKLLVELALAQSGEGAVDADVVPRGELGVEPDAELDERREQPGHADAPDVRHVDAGQDPEQRALAAPVRADHAEELARSTEKVTSLQRLVLARTSPPEGMEEVLLEERPLLVRDPERLRDRRDLDRRSTSEPLREVASLASEEAAEPRRRGAPTMAIGIRRPPAPRERVGRGDVVGAARAAEHDVADVLHDLHEGVEEGDLLRPGRGGSRRGRRSRRRRRGAMRRAPRPARCRGSARRAR